MLARQVVDSNQKRAKTNKKKKVKLITQHEKKASKELVSIWLIGGFCRIKQVQGFKRILKKKQKMVKTEINRTLKFIRFRKNTTENEDGLEFGYEINCLLQRV